jgi:hypothetical protein
MLLNFISLHVQCDPQHIESLGNEVAVLVSLKKVCFSYADNAVSLQKASSATKPMTPASAAAAVTLAERHVWDLLDRHKTLFQAPQGAAMSLFVWLDDASGVACFMDACSQRANI